MVTWTGENLSGPHWRKRSVKRGVTAEGSLLREKAGCHLSTTIFQKLWLAGGIPPGVSLSSPKPDG